MTTNRIGVILVNTGTPNRPDPEAVESYLRKFLSHPRIRPMSQLKWNFILNCFILPERSQKSALKYQSIWTFNGNPFTIEIQKLEDALNSRFPKSGENIIVRYAMSFARPFLTDAIRELIEAGCSELLILPLFPQSAYSTTGVVSDDLNEAKRSIKEPIDITLIDHYYENSLYIQAIANSILNAGFDPSPTSNDHLMLSFHSIPLTDIESGDTYDVQTAKTCELIAQELGIEKNRWSVGYQCRFDKERNWLEPYTTDTLNALASNDAIGRLYYVCPNFSIDCLETLYDIEKEIKPFYFDALNANQRPAQEDSFTYVPCLNSSKEHVELIADIIKAHIND